MEHLNDRGPAVFVVTLVLIVFATVFTVLRLISKWGVTRKATSDDFVAIMAWVFAVALSVSIMIGTRVGLGKPDSGILLEWVEPLKRSIYAFTVLYNPALMCTKTAILLLYLRMAAAHPLLRYASLFTLAVVNLSGIVLTFLNIFQCRPIAAAFSEIDGKCIDIVALYLASAPVNVLTDLAILLLPLPILTSLRIEFRQKVILVATFIVGGFVTIIDVVRIVYLQTALEEERQLNISGVITATTRPVNFTYHASFSLMWSAVEVSVGIMCCCVLVLKPLVMRVMPNLLRKERPHITTPESVLRSDISKEPRSPDINDIFEPHGSPLSFTAPSLANEITFPVSPRQPSPPELATPGMPQTKTLPSVPEARDEDDEGDMDFFQMLASDPPNSNPVMSPLQEAQIRRPLGVRRATILSARRGTVQTSASKEPTQEPTQNFFDFVNMKGKMPLTQLSAKEAWWPIMFVSILFFLWGFAYGLLDTLNAQIQVLLGYTQGHTIALFNAYWIAYFFGPLVCGYWVLKRQGFKATFMTGLAIYSVGAMSFWPSSVLRSFPGFFISNFIVALGLSCLEVAANPFIALAGPGELSEARLNFSQGFQAIGSVVSPLLASKALFSGIGEEDLFRVQWCYLAVAIFVVFLAVVFFYVPLSEASDDDLEAMALQRLYNAGMDKGEKTFRVGARRLLLWTGVFVMMCYVGAQECVSYFWTPFLQDADPDSELFWDRTISRSVFAFGRFLAAGLAYCGLPPRIILGFHMIGAFTASILAMVLPQGNGALGMLILIIFFESAIFPTVFAMTLRGQGRHTKMASAALTMAISGGSIWPSAVYGINKSHPGNMRYAMRIPIVLFAVSMPWPVILSSTRVLRRWVDPIWSKRRFVGGGEQGSLTVDWSSPPHQHKPFTAHLETTPGRMDGSASQHGKKGTGERKPSISIIT